MIGSAFILAAIALYGECERRNEIPFILAYAAVGVVFMALGIYILPAVLGWIYWRKRAGKPILPKPAKGIASGGNLIRSERSTQGE